MTCSSNLECLEIIINYIIIGKKLIDDNETPKKGSLKRNLSDEQSSDSDTSDSDYDVEDNIAPNTSIAGPKIKKKDAFEVVSQDPGIQTIKNIIVIYNSS